MTYDILLIGTGSLAESVALSLASRIDGPKSMAISGENSNRGNWIAAICNTLSDSFRGHATCDYKSLSWCDPLSIARVVSESSPKVVVNLASLQSPWQMAELTCPWARFVRENGFGITAPLQASIALSVGTALVHNDINSIFVNAAYPDAVNAMLRDSGVKVQCGLGNIDIIAAMEKSIRKQHTEPSRLLAHHYHVSSLITTGTVSEAPYRAWRDGVELSRAEVLSCARSIHLPKDQSINRLTGVISSSILIALLGNADYSGHAPGVYGLPGGYPIQIRDGELRLNLPPGLSEDAAVSWNTEMSRKDGLEIYGAGEYGFCKVTKEAQRALRLCKSGRFTLADIEDLSRSLVRLRARLRIS